MSLVFIVTIAIIQYMYEKRKEEYIQSLRKIFSYGYPVYGIVSETDKCEWIETFPFERLEYITSPIRGGKSYLETYAIQEAVKRWNIEENIQVIKMSGRYLLIEDELVNNVRNTDKESLLRECGNQMYTFGFMLQWKHFYNFYRGVDLELCKSRNIEKLVYDYILENCSYEKIDRLGICGNIDNGYFVKV